MPQQVAVTDEAAELLRRLVAQHGPVMFHQSGGCCDGSAPMCYPDGDFLLGGADVHLGDLLRIPGVTAARRSKLCPVQMTLAGEELQIADAETIGAKYKYLAVYELEADDPTALLEEIRRRSRTPDMPISEHMTEAYTILYENL